MAVHHLIERHWQRPRAWLSVLLWPWARLFAAVARWRRQRYLNGRSAADRLPVPVAVVGNIHAGGTGKTPVVQALVRQLQQRGVRVGIISRGYGRTGQGVAVLRPDSMAADVGDEPLLLYRTTGAPTAVAARRADAGRALLAAHPELELLIADDGLQHYALARDFEIAVFPAADVGRRLDSLPNGPLREPLSRLDQVDAVVYSGGGAETAVLPLPDAVYSCRSVMENGRPYRLGAPEDVLPAGYLKGRQVVAVAAIARPERFFRAVQAAGIELAATVALPDHAAWSFDGLPGADAYLVTEKDAVKLAPTGTAEVWVWPVRAQLPEALAERLLQRCLPQYPRA
ncbi:tetraacyldisaccharide 4'-kinase [Neisseria shayeganii]|uniref:Tetraacyldisaccharide 4'-kinase n=1 Tax=Neisseria shayeganii 871 TaxID=1032488 RepID=G4CGU2_9NEIS|nr:tetraacyldisaccharide 4'-kinase [Neisseria shayeganii]EGY52946.1 tetraacyldisaccharide 4'-kinase [Neisseria shayeganii 871]